MWNGTEATLNPIPISSSPSPILPITGSAAPPVCPAPMAASDVLPVAPQTSAIP